MTFEPSAEHALVEKTARQFARDVLAPRAAERDRRHSFPETEMRQLAQLGLVGMTVPESAGGGGQDALAQAHVIRAVAEADASVAVTLAVTNMVAEVLWRFGSPACQARFLPDLLAGRSVAGAFALSEAGAGSDPSALRTRCARTRGGYVLSGSKQWITSGAEAGVLVVVARHEDEASEDKARARFSAFAVARDSAGLSAGRPESKLGQRGSSTVPLTLQDVFVPEDQRLGEEGEGFKLALAALDGGRINVGAMAVGVSTAALSAAIDHARTRVQFGQPLSAFQGVQFMLADAATRLEGAWLLVQRAAWLKQQQRPCTRAAASAKLWASEAAQHICDSAVQIHGGYGYTREFPVERHLRDARVMTIYEGTSQIQKLVVARDLLRELTHGQAA